MLQPVVYLPIEIKNRELESRLMTACYLLERGVSVVLGQQWAVFLNARNWARRASFFSKQSTTSKPATW